MVKLNCSLFALAEKRLIRTGKKYTAIDVINDAVLMRKYLDTQDEKKESTQFKKS